MRREAKIRWSGLALLLAWVSPACTRWTAERGPAAPGSCSWPVAVSEPRPEPDPEPEPEPRFVRGAALLDAPVEDAGGVCRGRVEDLLLEPAGGRVTAVAVELALERPGGGPGPVCVLTPDRLVWSAERGALRVALFGPQLEVAGVADGDPRRLFASQELARVSGELIELEEGPGGELILKLRDGSNLLHRVLVEPACLLRDELGPLVRAGALEAVGVLTRDDTGKLLVAGALARDGRQLRLRDDAGDLLWRELARPLRSARALREATAVTDDGASYRTTGWLFDRQALAASHVLLEIDGVERALAWELLVLEPDGSLRIARDDAWIGTLPASFSGAVGDVP